MPRGVRVPHRGVLCLGLLCCVFRLSFVVIARSGGQQWSVHVTRKGTRLTPVATSTLGAVPCHRTFFEFSSTTPLTFSSHPTTIVPVSLSGSPEKPSRKNIPGHVVLQMFWAADKRR